MNLEDRQKTIAYMQNLISAYFKIARGIFTILINQTSSLLEVKKAQFEKIRAYHEKANVAYGIKKLTGISPKGPSHDAVNPLQFNRDGFLYIEALQSSLKGFLSGPLAKSSAVLLAHEKFAISSTDNKKQALVKAVNYLTVLAELGGCNHQANIFLERQRKFEDAISPLIVSLQTHMIFPTQLQRFVFQTLYSKLPSILTRLVDELSKRPGEISFLNAILEPEFTVIQKKNPLLSYYTSLLTRASKTINFSKDSSHKFTPSTFDNLLTKEIILLYKAKKKRSEINEGNPLNILREIAKDAEFELQHPFGFETYAQRHIENAPDSYTNIPGYEGLSVTREQLEKESESSLSVLTNKLKQMLDITFIQPVIYFRNIFNNIITIDDLSLLELGQKNSLRDEEIEAKEELSSAVKPKKKKKKKADTSKAQKGSGLNKPSSIPISFSKPGPVLAIPTSTTRSTLLGSSIHQLAVHYNLNPAYSPLRFSGTMANNTTIINIIPYDIHLSLSLLEKSIELYQCISNSITSEEESKTRASNPDEAYFRHIILQIYLVTERALTLQLLKKDPDSLLTHKLSALGHPTTKPMSLFINSEISMQKYHTPSTFDSEAIRKNFKEILVDCLQTLAKSTPGTNFDDLLKKLGSFNLDARDPHLTFKGSVSTTLSNQLDEIRRNLQIPIELLAEKCRLEKNVKAKEFLDVILRQLKELQAITQNKNALADPRFILSLGMMMAMAVKYAKENIGLFLVLSSGIEDPITAMGYRLHHLEAYSDYGFADFSTNSITPEERELFLSNSNLKPDALFEGFAHQSHLSPRMKLLNELYNYSITSDDQGHWKSTSKRTELSFEELQAALVSAIEEEAKFLAQLVEEHLLNEIS